MKQWNKIDYKKLEKDRIQYYDYNNWWHKFNNKNEIKIFIVGIVAGIPNKYMKQKQFYQCHRGWKSGQLIMRAIKDIENVFLTNLLSTTTTIHYSKIIKNNLYNIYNVGKINLYNNITKFKPQIIIALSNLVYEELAILIPKEMKVKLLYNMHPGYALRFRDKIDVNKYVDNLNYKIKRNIKLVQYEKENI